MSIDTIVLIDLDNCCHDKTLEAATSLYNENTLIVPIGLKELITKNKPNDHKWKRMHDWFRFVPEGMVTIKVNELCPDASDMCMFDYVGRNLPYWIINDIKNVIICSNDVDLYNLGFILKPHFNTWVMISKSVKLKYQMRNTGARKCGAGNVPMIYVKGV